MGKVIEQKYSDVNHRILKKTKKDKAIKRSPNGLTASKRKLSDVENDQPGAKFNKTDVTQEIVCLPQIPIYRADEINTFQICAIQTFDSVNLILKEDKAKDLFLNDELYNSYENFIYNDLVFKILDEISLEGLDGITLEAFWKRLSISLEQLNYINDCVKRLIWRFICRKKSINFFKLSEPRGVLDIYDRSKYMDHEIGVVIDFAFELPEIYPHEVVNYPEEQGSCSTFHTRINVSDEVGALDLRTVDQRYGSHLVIVASQKLRKNALMYESSDPTMELVNMEYCMLERIGRARKHGELTQGNMSIASHIGMEPKSVYHYEKQLRHYSLVAKQFFYIKSAIADQNKTGKLLHLKRFYHKVKPKQMLIAEQIINVMKQRPDCRIEIGELRKIFKDVTPPISKIIKNQEFRKYVMMENVCYRDLYPNAHESEYMRKSTPTEKFIKCLTLVNPFVNITATWLEQDVSDDEKDDDEEPTGAKIINMECFKEVYLHISSKGRDGCTLQDIKKLIGIDSNTVRMCLKKLTAKKVITVKKFDHGKQRHLLYYATSLHENKVKPDMSLNELKTQNKVFEMIKKRQSLRRSKEASLKKKDGPSKKCEFGSKLELKVPQELCPFFIRNIKPFICNRSDCWSEIQFIRLERNYRIPLNKQFPRTEQLFDINTLLREIDNDKIIRMFDSNFNPDFSYSSRTDKDYITKVILLKAALGEIIINANTLNCFTNKRKRSNVPVIFTNIQKENTKANNPKLQYMGPNPVIVFTEKEDDVVVEIAVSTPPAAFKNNMEYHPSKELSERVISRIGIVLRTVYEKKVIDEAFRLGKIIEEEEFKNGYPNKIDRKSLARILTRLVQEGYIKIFKMTIYDNHVTKTHTFVCHPSITPEDSLIKSCCQQIKWKYFIGAHNKATTKSNLPAIQKNLEETIKITASPFRQSDVMNSVLELKQLTKRQTRQIVYKPSRLAGKLYGFKPKFVRMRVIHEFLFYLIYAYDRNSKPLEESEMEKLFQSYHINVTKTDLKQIPKVYTKEISWKTFIPPLPAHDGWIAGWTLMCDVILRLPIMVFCEIYNVSYDIPELEEILNHPIKRFYLVKDLEPNIRFAILARRKYLFDIHDTICKLAWCGLVQFGPQKYKEKDQVFIYLNRRASLFDTTTSEPAYNKTTIKEYRKMAFFFNRQSDVDNYWYHAYGICLGTKLNLRQGGQLVTIFDPQTKPELSSALKSKTPEEAVNDDNGEIPGDRRGAAGFDSSLWAHITKNWFWTNKKISTHKPPPNMGLRKEKLEKILPKNVSYNELHTVTQSKVYLHKAHKREKNVKIRTHVHVPVRPSKCTQKIVRTLPFRKRKRQYNDPIDKAIVKRIGCNVRMQWTKKENRALFICMAACLFLNPRLSKKQNVPYSVIRDALHRLRPESKNKTSRAIQRRMKNRLHTTDRFLWHNAQNFIYLKPIADYYSPLLYGLRNGTNKDNLPIKFTDAQIAAAFIILLSYLLQHQEDVMNVLQGKSRNIDYLARERLQTLENNLIPLEEIAPKYRDVKEMEDIKKDVIKSVIHSSLACEDKSVWSFQLFKIYQRYPNNLISSALNELKHSQMISFSKFETRKVKNFWQSAFQLSNIYIYSQAATFHIITAVEAYRSFLSLRKSEKFLDFSTEVVDSKKYGQLLGLNEFFTFWRNVQFKFYLPQTMVILNPHIKDHSEVIDDLAMCWQAKLKKMFQDNTDADLEQESENENQSKLRDDLEAPSTSKEDVPMEIDDIDNVKSFQESDNNPLDETVDPSISETIDRLKTWVTDCMEAERERRSPSPEFIIVNDGYEDKTKKELSSEVTEEQQKCFEEVDRPNTNILKKTFTKDQMPTLDQIKEGMLKHTPANEERLIPYLTDLSSFLNRDLSDINLDEEKLERLKSHFITQYAVLEEIILDEREQLEDFYMVEYIESKMRNKMVWEKLLSKLVVKNIDNMPDVRQMFGTDNGKECDYDVINLIVDFVLEKKYLGASGVEIKEHFQHVRMTTFPLEVIIKNLVDAGIFLRVGICSLTFVHYMYRSPWLVETFQLSNTEQKFLEEKASNENVREDIEKQLENKTLINVTMMPWMKIDGTMNDDALKTWLCNVLSHCLENPNIMFSKLCEKFCFLKPVDIYYLVEILKELGCVDLYVYDKNQTELFSNWEYINDREATILDRFEDIYIIANNVAVTCMGSFFCENNMV